MARSSTTVLATDNASPNTRPAPTVHAHEHGKAESHLFADSQYDRLPALAAELVRRRVAIIYAINTANAVQAAKAATSEIPIVFANGSDPVKLGLAESLNRPGGNVTGVSYYVGALVAKRLELLRELVPQAITIGFLTNPTNLISRP
jgi:putative tryptophan/tyrosine transport system substrate-binding protein